MTADRRMDSLSSKEIQSKLLGGLCFKLGVFNVELSTTISEVCDHLKSLYGSYPLIEDEFIDFRISLSAPSILRKYLRPQVNFYFDGYAPFLPLPYQQAPAMFEWGLNWCITNHSNQFLIIHAAVVELNGRAFIFPGAPGSGKSTLCAALVCEGWRLLSDEMTLLALGNGEIFPFPRPVSLKNQSIDIIRSYSLQAMFGKTVDDTSKGNIAHMRAPDESVNLADKTAIPCKIIFPKYQQNAKTQLTAISKGLSTIKTAEQCFNYNTLGAQGFTCLFKLVDQCDCYELSYSHLKEAINLFTEMACD